ncbi:MAG: glycoside hydrolase family 16 protein [Microbacterium sp.]
MDTWSDDFAGPAGTAPNSSRWGADLGGGGWGDAQEQFYTHPPANAALTGRGQLAITARSGPGTPSRISSARLTTQGRVAFRYGRIAARIKVPMGAGVWPAFWMLGTDIDAVGWPACGEIDVMESVGGDPAAVYGTVHGPGYAGVGRGVGRRHTTGSPLSYDFHTYAVDWAPGSLTWHIDGEEFFHLTPGLVPGPWPFDHHFFLILNLAFGGGWPGNDADPSALPAEMLVDWVRITDSDVRSSSPPAVERVSRAG